MLAHEEAIRAWVKGGNGADALSIVKIEELLARQGVVVPYRTLHRFATALRLPRETGHGAGPTDKRFRPRLNASEETEGRTAAPRRGGVSVNQ